MARRTTKSSSGTSKTAAKSRAESTKSAGRTARQPKPLPASARGRRRRGQTLPLEGDRNEALILEGNRAHALFSDDPGEALAQQSRSASRLPSQRSSRRPRSHSWPGAPPSPGSPSSRPAWRSSPSIAGTRWATAWPAPESGLASWAATSNTPVTPRRTSATRYRNSTRLAAIGSALNAAVTLPSAFEPMSGSPGPGPESIEHDPAHRRVRLPDPRDTEVRRLGATDPISSAAGATGRRAKRPRQTRGRFRRLCAGGLGS